MKPTECVMKLLNFKEDKHMAKKNLFEKMGLVEKVDDDYDTESYEDQDFETE